MSMTESLHESSPQLEAYPGQQLARAREAQGYSQEYVAGKLYLRVRVIELLEADAYEDLPQTVFVQGYLRAYAKLLGVPVAPLLELYAAVKRPEARSDKILRQRHREPQYWDVILRWMAGVGAFLLVVGAFVWWSHYRADMQIATAPKLMPAQETKVSLDEGMNGQLFASTTDLTPLASPIESSLSLQSELPLTESNDG